jgi:hypothetical protein
MEIALVEALDATVMPASALMGTPAFAEPALLMPSAIPVLVGAGRKRQGQRSASDGRRHHGSCKAFHDRPPGVSILRQAYSINARARSAMTVRPQLV